MHKHIREMALQPSLIKMLSEKAGVDVATPSGATILRLDLEKVTGEPISLNTVKRLVGIIDTNRTHTSQILDIIAVYLGFSSYKILENYLGGNVSDFNIKDGFTYATALPPGAEVEMEWEPDRYVRIIHEEADRFVVEESRNSKLQKGDQIRISHLKAGFPLYASAVERNGTNLGTYQAATLTGLTRLTCHES